MRRIADCDRIGGNVSCNHRTRADNGIRANRDARRDRNVRTKPHVVTNRHRRSMFPASQSRCRIQGMIRRGNGTTRADQAILAKRYISAAAHHEILVQERAAANGQADAIIHIERRRELYTLPCVGNELVEQAVGLVRIIEEDAVDRGAGTHGLASKLRQRLRFAVLRRLTGEQPSQILVGRDQRLRLLRHARLLRHDFHHAIVSAHTILYSST